MYDGIAVLKAYGPSVFDEYGNEKPQIEGTTVYVQPRSVYSSEYYSAAQLGLKPSITLVISNREDYAGQKVVEYEGMEYSVVRVDWNAQRDSISLVCEERTGVANYMTDENGSILETERGEFIIANMA